MKWMRSTADEINRLYNTNKLRFIRRSNIPKGQKVTYSSFVVDIKDHNEEKERTRLTIGGDQIECPGDKSTRTAGLTTEKILISSVILTPSAKFLVIDINNFLFEHPPRTIRVYGDQFGIAPSINDQKVRSERTCTGRKGLHRDSERNVRFAASRHPRQRTVTAQSHQGWLPPDDPHSRLMDTILIPYHSC
jgi:hypothetical protein